LKVEPSAMVLNWLGQNEPELAVDPIILAEVRVGM
jgi:hypothetical protein